jgi:hypothetical protein
MTRLYLLFAGVAMAVSAAAATPEIVLHGDPPAVRVRSTAIRGNGDVASWAAQLRVTVDIPDAPRLAGTYHAEPGVLTFTPRYPLQSGLTYRAAFVLGSESATVTLTPRKTGAPAAATVVERVYPTASVWPENQLRFYIHFTAPMSRGEAFERIHLLDRNKGDAEIKLPFLEIDQELWDREQRRLTILFDPGRVKRGLVPHNEAGPPLVAGGRYLLVVDADWKDASNRSLAQAFRKEFTVGPAWREGIDVRQWKLATPQAGTRESVRINFPRPLDSALLLRCITVPAVDGEASIGEGETEWRFVPSSPWAAAPQTVSVLEILEDLAGNKVGRPFDVDRFERVDRTVSTGNVKLEFTPKMRPNGAP